MASSGRKKFGTVFLPDAAVLRRYCDLNPQVRAFRTDRDDATKHRITKNDADGDHIVIRTNGTTLEVRAFADGVLLPPDAGAC